MVRMHLGFHGGDVGGEGVEGVGHCFLAGDDGGNDQKGPHNMFVHPSDEEPEARNKGGANNDAEGLSFGSVNY